MVGPDAAGAALVGSHWKGPCPAAAGGFLAVPAWRRPAWRRSSACRSLTLWPQCGSVMYLSHGPGVPLFSGKKLTIALEELGLPYTFHKVTFDHVKDPWFTKISPNGKIPAIAINAPAEGEDGTPELTLMESGAIMAYLGKLAGGKLMGGADPVAEAKVNQWLFWVNAGVGTLARPLFMSLHASVWS